MDRKHDRLALAAGALLCALAACGPACGDVAAGGSESMARADLPATTTAPSAVAPPAPPHIGLSALAAGDGAVRVHWSLPAGNWQAALFHAASPEHVVDGAPALSGLTGTSALITGLENGRTRWFALGIRPAGGDPWVQAGVVLCAHPNPPIYVDAQANGGGDGSSPATAFATLPQGLAAAAAQTDANLWIRDGRYVAAGHALPAGVHLSGGFPAGRPFVLAERAPLAERTVVDCAAPKAAFRIDQVGGRVVLDGLVLDGGGKGLCGIDQESADLELRAATVRNFADRGLRLRNSANEPSTVILCSSSVHHNGNDGLSLSGPYSLRLDACCFDANAQEGVDCGNLTALDGSTSTLAVTDCRFWNNGAEGLDATLAQPPMTTVGSGRFDVLVRGSTFAGNALDGLLVDQDHELAPGWYAHVIVRDCEASDNAGSGVHIDADAAGDFLLHRVRACRNHKDGIWVSSETEAGHVVVSASELRDNRQAGIRASLGNKIVLASHCVFTGNVQAGFVSTVGESTATNCIAWLQPEPFQGVRTLGSPAILDAGAPVFVDGSVDGDGAPPRPRVGCAWRAGRTAGRAAFAANGPVAHGAVACPPPLAAAVLAGAAVAFAPEPLPAALPVAPAPVRDRSGKPDLHLCAGSVVAGAGMSAPGAGPVDPGPFGSPRPGTPGVADPADVELVTLEHVLPPIATRPVASQPVVLQFSHALAPCSVTTALIRVVDEDGRAVAATTTADGCTVTLHPPAGGWGQGPLRIELHRGITARNGEPFVAPMIVPLRAR